MEDPNANNITPTTTTTKGTTTPTPTPASTTPTTATTTSARRRRKGGAAQGIENVDLQDSKYAQIRALLKDLRPSFIEILKAPDYRNSKPALDVRRGMKQMMELCKQLRAETVSLGKNKRPFDGTPTAGENVDDHGNKRHKDDTTRETYLVGGSPLGWNFIMFIGTGKKSLAVA
eukprot:Gb_28032 [translate_table: standard]